MKKIEAMPAHLMTDKESSHACGKFEWFYFKMQFKAKKNMTVKIQSFLSS